MHGHRTWTFALQVRKPNLSCSLHAEHYPGCLDEFVCQHDGLHCLFDALIAHVYSNRGSPRAAPASSGQLPRRISDPCMVELSPLSHSRPFRAAERRISPKHRLFPPQDGHGGLVGMESVSVDGTQMEITERRLHEMDISALNTADSGSDELDGERSALNPECPCKIALPSGGDLGNSHTADSLLNEV